MRIVGLSRDVKARTIFIFNRFEMLEYMCTLLTYTDHRVLDSGNRTSIDSYNNFTLRFKMEKNST